MVSSDELILKSLFQILLDIKNTSSIDIYHLLCYVLYPSVTKLLLLLLSINCFILAKYFFLVICVKQMLNEGRMVETLGNQPKILHFQNVTFPSGCVVLTCQSLLCCVLLPFVSRGSWVTRHTLWSLP